MSLCHPSLIIYKRPVATGKQKEDICGYTGNRSRKPVKVSLEYKVFYIRKHRNPEISWEI